MLILISVIKYSDEHVPGSPFIVNVSHAPDASKVRVYGPGIEHGILSTYAFDLFFSFFSCIFSIFSYGFCSKT